MSLTHDQATAAVRDAVRHVVPDADLDALAPDADLRDELELDSLDFLAFVEVLTQRTGVRLDEDDYPQLRTLESAVRLLDRRGPGHADR